MDQRLKLRKNLHKDFPVPFPDDSDLEIAAVAKHFRELGILQGPKI